MRTAGSARCWQAYDDAAVAGMVWGIVAESVTAKPGRVKPAAPAAASEPPPAPPSPLAAASAAPLGSCQCDCPPAQGFGYCLDVGTDSAPPAPAGPKDNRDLAVTLTVTLGLTLIG